MRWLAPVLVLVALLAAGCVFASDPTPAPKPDCPTAPPSANSAQDELTDAARAVVTTNKGAFTIELDTDSTPIAVASFVALARCGFYDGISFHRVLAGFVAQAGDPGTRTNRGDFAQLGAGGPGYRFEVEFPPRTTTYPPGTVALANGVQFDPRTFEITGNTESNGSQFFIALADLQLPPYYSVLGTVADPADTIDTIAAVPVNGDAGLPLDPVIIDTIAIEGAIPAASPTT